MAVVKKNKDVAFASSSEEGRVAFAKAALKMANDNFFSVGLNNWGIKINPPYTY